MNTRVSIIQSSASATSVPGWNDYEYHMWERLFVDPGVISGLTVTQRAAGANLSVDIAAGSALVEITNTNVTHGKTYKVYVEGTGSAENIIVEAAHPTNARIDLLVLKVLIADPNASSGNLGAFSIVKGTAASSPVAPATPANSIPLGQIAVAANATSITNANLTDVSTKAKLKDIASTATGKGASLVGIEDAGGYILANTVEGALQELGARLGTPTGASMDWWTDTAPTGWLLCYGQAVSRTTYSALYAVIGTTHGTGDGSTTFNLPDLRGRFRLGQDDMGGTAASRVSGATTLGVTGGTATKNLQHTHNLTAVTVGSGTGASVSNASPTTQSLDPAQDIMPPYVVCNVIMKT